LQDSVVKYEKAVQDMPKDAGVAASLTEFQAKRLDNFRNAIPRFEKVVELDPKDEDTWRLIGVCHFSLASLTADMASAGKASVLEEVFGNPPVPDELWASAESSLTEATGRFPDDPNLCRMMLVTLAQRGKVEEVRKWKEKCP